MCPKKSKETSVAASRGSQKVEDVGSDRGKIIQGIVGHRKNDLTLDWELFMVLNSRVLCWTYF